MQNNQRKCGDYFRFHYDARMMMTNVLTRRGLPMIISWHMIISLPKIGLLTHDCFLKYDYLLTYDSSPYSYISWTMIISLPMTILLQMSISLPMIISLQMSISLPMIISLITGIFSSIFYHRYSVVKTQPSMTHFHNSYSIAIVEVLFVIHYPLEKYFKGHFFTLEVRFPAI